jgi:phenylpropionate dioxygenase-like ring-hydroxylating dioxygenase large terminal subunit
MLGQVKDRAGTPASGLRDEWRAGKGELPAARYCSKEFAALEAEQLWGKAWQMACRIDQLPEVGSYVVYDILDQSVVVVRVDEQTVKAFHNVCPHRATALAVDTGRFQLKQIVCPFHGWKWNLSGENTFVADLQEFRGGCMTNADADLTEVHCEVWAGFVYISMAPDPVPFDEFVAPIRELVDGVLLGEMKFHYHYQARVNANWKVALEAFIEAYHVPQTHPQLTPGSAADFTALYTYEPMANGHGLFHSSGANSVGRISREQLAKLDKGQQVEALLRGLQTLHTGQDAQAHIEELEIVRTLRNRDIPEGMTVGAYFQTVIREHYAAQGRAIGTFENLSKVGDMHIFPHVVFLPTYGNAVMYRARPSPDNDPDWCIFDMYAIRTYPEGMAPPPWQTIHAEGRLDQAKTWFLIPSQDFSSIVRQQRGMHSLAFRSAVLSARQESLILNLHHEIDRYLDGELPTT